MASSTRSAPLVCDLAAGGEPHLGTVGLLARLQLFAGRLGYELRLRNVSPELLELVSLAGLEDVLLVEPGRQPEEREDPLGVEEEGDLGDPVG
jgi:hypothetical protein